VIYVHAVVEDGHHDMSISHRHRPALLGADILPDDLSWIVSRVIEMPLLRWDDGYRVAAIFRDEIGSGINDVVVTLRESVRDTDKIITPPFVARITRDNSMPGEGSVPHKFEA